MGKADQARTAGARAALLPVGLGCMPEIWVRGAWLWGGQRRHPGWCACPSELKSEAGACLGPGGREVCLRVVAWPLGRSRLHTLPSLTALSAHRDSPSPVVCGPTAQGSGSLSARSQGDDCPVLAEGRALAPGPAPPAQCGVWAWAAWGRWEPRPGLLELGASLPALSTPHCRQGSQRTAPPAAQGSP